MAHFSRLCLKNFKVFKNFTEFELAPVTVLTGTNNSGKSSVFKALALLTDSAGKNNLEKLEFIGNSSSEENFTTTKNRNSKNKRITFEFDLANFQVSGSFAQYNNIFHEILFDDFTMPYPSTLTVKCVYEQEKVNGKLVKFELFYRGTKILSFHVDFKRGHSIYLNIRWLMSRTGDSEFLGVNDELLKKLFSTSTGKDLLKFIRVLDGKILDFLSSHCFNKNEWNLINKKFSDSEFEKADYQDIIVTYLRFFNHFGLKRLNSPINLLFSKEEISKYGNFLEKLKDKAISEVLSPIIEGNYTLYFEPFLLRIINKVAETLEVKYIKANRAKQRRIYFPNNPNDGCDDLFFKLAHSDLSPEVLDFVKKWLNLFGIGTELQFEDVKGVATIVSVVRENQTYDLTDIGVGSIQLLSLISNIALLADNRWIESQDGTMRTNTLKKRFKVLPDGKIKIKNLKNDYNVIHEDDPRYKNKEFSKIEFFDYKTLLIEEPETNLHPNLQSKLAEMFVEAERKFNIQFIIETHSEYLIRNLQLLITEGKIMSNDVNIYYLNDSNHGGEQVKMIQIDSQGNLLQQFGSGFFDVSLMLQEELLKKQEIASLKNEIEKINRDFQTHIRCLVLTEDMKGLKDKPWETALGLLLNACGFNLQETMIRSYRSCNKLQIALGMAEMAESFPNIKKIILHQDKDGEGDKRSSYIEKQIKAHGLKKTSYFITRYNDIEGYFLNSKHINALYPELPEDEIQEFIDKAMESVKEKSIENLSQKYGNNRDVAITAYNSNPIEYVHTKYLKGALNSSLNNRLQKPPDIFRFSTFLHDGKLSQIANEIWPKLRDR